MDKIQAQKNIALYERNIKTLLEYNHIYSTPQFKDHCSREITELRERVRMLRHQLEKC